MRDKNISLIAVFLLGAFLRIIWLDHVPVSLFGDELDVGYHAYSISQTGRDYLGRLLPAYIHSFSEWRAPVLMYFTAPFVRILGLNEWAVRLPSALLGSLTIPLIYWLTRKHGTHRLALISAIIMAITPWHIHYSRTAFEVATLIFLILFGTLNLLNNRPIIALISFILSLYTYNTSIIFVPLLVTYLLVSQTLAISSLPRSKKIILTFLLVIGLVPLTRNILDGKASLRFNQNSLFSNPMTEIKINLARNQGSLGSIERLFHNKPLAYLRDFASGYLIAFSPQFLALTGDPNLRHSTGEMGMLYVTQYLLLIIGITLSVNRQSASHKLWLFWLLISPIAASLTKDTHHATRLFLMLPPIVYFSAMGLEFIYSRRKKFTILIMALMVIEFAAYQERYWNHYRTESWRWWHFGYKEAMTYISQTEREYDRIFINNTYEPALIRFLFYTGYSPTLFHKLFTVDQPQPNIAPSFAGFRLDKYYFGSLTDKSVEQFVQTGDLYLVSQRDEVPGDWDWSKSPPAGLRVQKTVTNPYGEPIFYLVTKDESR